MNLEPHISAMGKDEVAEILVSIATLLDLKGENPFKSRAYLNAARAPACPEFPQPSQARRPSARPSARYCGPGDARSRGPLAGSFTYDPPPEVAWAD